MYLAVHASCFSSCQNATPLVRFETLSLMQLALKRATAVVEQCRAQERSAEGTCIYVPHNQRICAISRLRILRIPRLHRQSVDCVTHVRNLEIA